MPKDFLGFVSRPLNLRLGLSRIVLGALMAMTGLPIPVAAATTTGNIPQNVGFTAPTIVDRSKKSGKLVLRLVGGPSTGMTPQHRSHRSHSSHRSSSSGTVARPVPTPAPSSSPKTLLAAPGASASIGEITSIDRAKRIITVKQSPSVTKLYGFRDDTTFEATPGIFLRFDDFSESNNGRLPVAIGDRVQVVWRTSPDGTTLIATTLKTVR